MLLLLVQTGGWRIMIQVEGDDRMELTMYNVWPEGQEDIAVRVAYKRF